MATPLQQAKKHSIATRKRDFLYSLFCAGPYTNTDYKRFGIKQHTNCTYCKYQEQDFEHLFIHCKEVNDLRNRIVAKWETQPTMKECILGTENTTYKDRAITHIMIEFNHYVQRTNWKGEQLSLTDFKRGIRATEHIEKIIAMKRTNIEAHEAKWEHIFRLIG